MSVMHCEFCDRAIDTDADVEHFNERGECFRELCASGEHEMETYRVPDTDFWYRECVNCGAQEEP